MFDAEILDSTKIEYYEDRVKAWERGERIAPISIDMALTTTCNYKCSFCYATLQHNKTSIISKQNITDFLDDCKEIGVKGVSLVSDGESSISPIYSHTITYGHSIGLDMASGTNGYLLKGKLLETIFPNLTYLRINISAGEKNRYNEIMGAPEGSFEQVVENIKTMVKMKKEWKSNCTIGMQMVFMPEFEDQLIPLAHLAIDLEVDYLVIKHCSDDEFGTLGVRYGDYERCYKTLKEVEALSNNKTRIKVKWSKIQECSKDGACRKYSSCYGPPFLLQLSGTGLIAPCGMLFNERYAWSHIGNLTKTRFKEMWNSERYWMVMNHLAGFKTIPGVPRFNPQTMCGTLCLQHVLNRELYKHIHEKNMEFHIGDITHKSFL